MRQKHRFDDKRHPQKQSIRPTIGLLAGHLDDRGYLAGLWSGVTAMAREQGVNTLAVVGGALGSPHRFESQQNILYKLVGAHNVDGLIIVSTVGQYLSSEEFQLFWENYQPLPMVMLSMAQEGLPSILIDNSKGVRDALSHLIETHRYRRIAFISGPQGDKDSEERYRTYMEVLAEYGLPFDPELVVSGDYSVESGKQAISLLLDQRQVKFEAVMAADDNMAFGVLEALPARGIQVPDEIAVAGFDDVEASRCTPSPLTTVRQPVHELGQQAVRLVLAQLQGETVPERMVLPTQLVVRQSCGCLLPTAVQAAAWWAAAESKEFSRFVRNLEVESFDVALAARRKQILEEMAQAIGANPVGLAADWAEQLLDALVVELKEKRPHTFLPALVKLLHQMTVAGGDLTRWQEVLSALRYHILPCLASNDVLFQAEDLWQQARVLIAETTERVQVYRRLKTEQQLDILGEISQTLSSSLDLEELVEAIAQEVPRLGIECCYLSLYENRLAPTETARLILAYNEQGRIELEAGGRVFPAQQLVPEGIIPPERQADIVIAPLYFKQEQLGFVLFSGTLGDGVVYEALRQQFGNALNGVLLVQREARALAEAEESRQKAEAALNEALAIQRQYLQQEWQSYTASTEAVQGYFQSGKQQGPTAEAWLTSMTSAIQQAETVTQAKGQLDEQLKATLAVPIRLYDQVFGVIGLARDEGQPWYGSEISAVEAVVEQVALALENKRLLLQTKKLATELATVAEMSIVASTILETNQLLQTVVDLAKTRFGLYHVHIYLLNEAGGFLNLAAGAGEVGQQMMAQGWRIPIGQEQSLVARAARSQQSVIINDVQSAPDFLPNALLPETRSEIAVPMIMGNKLVGVFDLQADVIDRFTQEDAHIQTILAGQVAVALQNARLYKETQVRVEQERLIRTITDKIHRGASREAILQVTLAELGQLLSASKAVARLGTQSQLLSRRQDGSSN